MSTETVTTTDAPAAALAARRAPAGPALDAQGVFDISFEAYHAHPALSKSKMVQLLPPSCPAQFRYDQDHPQPPKQVFDFGHAAHRLLLGAGENLAVIDADSWRDPGAGRDRDFARGDGYIPLLTKDFEKAKAMAQAVRRHPLAGRLFIDGRPEQSLFWIDPESGVQMRARLDWLSDPRESRLVVADFKTIRDVGLDTIERSIYDYAYHMQDVQYRDGVMALELGDEDTVMVFVFASKQPPFLVRCVQLELMALKLGRARIRRAVATYLECTRTGHWPGYDETAYAALPPWGEKRDEEEYL